MNPFHNKIIKITTCPSCSKSTQQVRPTSLPHSYFIGKGATLGEGNLPVITLNKPCIPNC